MKVGFTPIRQPADYRGSADSVVEITLQKTQSAAMSFLLVQGNKPAHWSAASSVIVPAAITPTDGTYAFALPKGARSETARSR